MNINDIPTKDLNIIRDVADHVVRRTFIKGIEDEDLRQELTVIGMTEYVKNWNEDKQVGKPLAKRDNNLRIYLQRLLKNRTHNINRSINSQKKGGNVTVTSIDPQDTTFERFSGEEDAELSTEIFRSLGLTEDQVIVLAYIAGNGLNKGGSNTTTKSTMSEDLGFSLEEINGLLAGLKDNYALKDMLTDRI